MSSKSGSDRVGEKLRRCLEAHQYYEAHQMFRSLYFRYSTTRRYGELIGLMFDGAEGLLGAGQTASGYDLANLFVETLINAEAPVDQVALDRIVRLFQLLRTCDDRSSFVAAVVKWSTQVDPAGHKYGHPDVHGKFASAQWQEGNMQEARRHFLLSGDGEGCAAFLVELQLKFAYRGEVDLIIAQAVFQLLSSGSENVAAAAFASYTAKHPDIRGQKGAAKGPPYSLPLLNFVWMLLLAVNNRSAGNRLGQFSTLVRLYQPSIQRDPSYSQYLDRIGQIFFGLPPPAKPQPTGPGGFLSNLLQTFAPGALLNQSDSGDESEEVKTPLVEDKFDLD